MSEPRRAPIVVDHHGPHGTETRLDFIATASEGDRTREVLHGQLTGQRAYDAWHLALLLEELLACRRETGERPLDQLPRPEKHLSMALLWAASPEACTMLELGSSLGELLDGLAMIDRVLERRGRHGIAPLPLDRLQFQGVDISPLLNDAARALHPERSLELMTSVAAATGNPDLLYDRNVSSYAFTDAGALAAFLNRAGAALLNLFVVRGATFAAQRMGKTLTYFSLAELCEQLTLPLYHLHGSRAPGPLDGPLPGGDRDVTEGFFLLAPPEVASRYLALGHAHPECARWFSAKGVALTDARTLCHESPRRSR